MVVTFMKLDQFLKWQGWVSTGGEAKQVIQSGQVKVNGSVETRRGLKLKAGDYVRFGADFAYVHEIGTKGP